MNCLYSVYYFWPRIKHHTLLTLIYIFEQHNLSDVVVCFELLYFARFYIRKSPSFNNTDYIVSLQRIPYFVVISFEIIPNHWIIVIHILMKRFKTINNMYWANSCRIVFCTWSWTYVWSPSCRHSPRTPPYPNRCPLRREPSSALPKYISALSASSTYQIFPETASPPD
jgi:hypothetical protein